MIYPAPSPRVTPRYPAPVGRGARGAGWEAAWMLGNGGFPAYPAFLGGEGSETAWLSQKCLPRAPRSLRELHPWRGVLPWERRNRDEENENVMTETDTLERKHQLTTADRIEEWSNKMDEVIEQIRAESQELIRDARHLEVMPALMALGFADQLEVWADEGRRMVETVRRVQQND